MQVKALESNMIESQPGCVAATLSILGNKWTGLIVKELSEGRARFSELEKSLKGISPRTLSQRLDDMEQCGLISKKSYAEVPPRVEYTLTEKGKDLFPILNSMAQWGNKYYSAAP